MIAYETLAALADAVCGVAIPLAAANDRFGRLRAASQGNLYQGRGQHQAAQHGDKAAVGLVGLFFNVK